MACALLSAVARLCVDVARLTDEQWADIDSDKCRSDRYSHAELAAMTYDAIVEMLEEAGLPLAYDHFAEGESPDPPFLVFLFPSSDNFSADGIVYQRIDALHIELYSDRKQPDVERRLKTVLDRHGVFYEKTEVWIDTERLYEALYVTEVLRTD